MAKDQLIVALDLPDVDAAEAMITCLGDTVNFYKIGYQLAYAQGGLALARELAHHGVNVFLDLKLHDINNTVSKAVDNIVKLNPTFLTVHGYPQTMEAAVEAARGSGLQIIAVTVLTSYNDYDLNLAGYHLDVIEVVERRARLAQKLGVDGIVCSGREVSNLRKIVKDSPMLLVTPGIRPSGIFVGDDQKRIMTPQHAIAAGADYLVVGRPILEADDPKAAAEAIQAQIEEGTTNQ